MKNHVSVFIIAISILLISCHPNKIESGSKEYNEIKNASEIFGLFDLKLGITTVKDLKASEYSTLEPNYSIGVYKINISDFSEQHNYEKELRANQRVKQFYYSEYKYNNLTVDGVSLFFLDNKLVGVHIEFPNLSKGFDLLKDFQNKYGDGIGKESWYYVLKWNSEKGNYEYGDEGYHTEERSWKNSNIEVKYDNRVMTFKIIDKFNEFDTLMKAAIDEEMKKYNDNKNKKIQSSI